MVKAPLKIQLSNILNNAVPPYSSTTKHNYNYTTQHCIRKSKLKSHLKVDPLQVGYEGYEEVGIVKLLCQLGHCFRLRLLVSRTTQHFFQRS